jgi:hypothetical protein
MKRDIPIACSLPASEMNDRVAEFRDLGARTTARELRPGHLVLRFSRAEGLAETLQNLVQREKECCPFLTFRIEEEAGEIRVDVSGPLESQPVLESLFGR